MLLFHLEVLFYLKVLSYLEVLFFLPLLSLAPLPRPTGKPLLQEVINPIKVYLDKEKRFKKELYNILKIKL